MSEKLSILFNRIKSNSDLLTASEAQTSQGIVLPILNHLGWDVFDTTEVTPEYSVGGRRVDFALRIQSVNKTFLEIKKVSENLENHQEQLVYYAFQQGVKLAILTNGITWQFYLPLEEGSWEQRRFFTIDLMEQSVEDTIEKFENLLSRENIESGNAYQEAKTLYEGRQKNKIIKENLPKAWQKLVSDPDEMLVELLNETLEKICGYKAEDEQIVEFLYRKFSKSDVKITDLKFQKKKPMEKLVESNMQRNDEPDAIRLNTDWLMNLSFTKIINGKFAETSAASWRGLLNIGLKIAFDKQISLDKLRTELDANFKEGAYNENGYSEIGGTNFSLQGQDSNDTANNALRLAKLLNCEIYVLFEWGEKGKFPMKKGLIHWKP